MGFDLSQGLSSYDLRADYSYNTTWEFTTPSTTLAYRIASKQFIGYGRAFFIEAREAFNVGFVDSATIGNTVERLKRNHLTNMDAVLGTSILLSRCLKLTMRPVAGFEYHYLKQTVQGNKTDSALAEYTLRFWGPLAGIGFGMNPTKRLSLSSRFAFHFPRAHHRVDLGVKSKLNIKRHGLSFLLSSAYCVKENVTWSLDLEYRGLATYGYGNPEGTSTEYGFAHLSQASITSGLQFSF